MKTIAVLGTLDSKGAEHAFVAELIRAHGCKAVLIDVGTGGESTVEPDFTRYDVAVGLDLDAVIGRKDRGECVTAMSGAIPGFLAKLHAEGKIDGVISLGGGGGTAKLPSFHRAAVPRDR